MHPRQALPEPLRRAPTRESQKTHRDGEAGGLDLLLPRHEDEDVPRRMAKVHGNGLLHGSFHIILLQQWGRVGVGPQETGSHLGVVGRGLCSWCTSVLNVPISRATAALLGTTWPRLPPTWGVLEKRTSTGKVRPGILKMGTEPKKSENFWESRVAEVTMRRKSRRRATTCSGWLVEKREGLTGSAEWSVSSAPLQVRDNGASGYQHSLGAWRSGPSSPMPGSPAPK